MAESLRTSKDNHNEKHRKRRKSRDSNEMSNSKSVDEGRADGIPECAVCLQTCVHPAKLPCSHIFCFLCLKGLATQSRRCAMCRQDIPLDYLDHPNLLDVAPQPEKEAFEDGYQWFYEGRSGWWQYDERTSKELEAAYKGGQRTCELLIVGQLYIADFDAMLQLRRNDLVRRRRIKRDLASIPKKGIAGLRLEGASPLPEDMSQSPNASRNESPQRQPEEASMSSALADHSEHVWQNDRGADFLMSNDFIQMRLQNESDQSQVNQSPNQVSVHNSNDNNDNGSSTDQIELEDQIRRLQLH